MICTIRRRLKEDIPSIQRVVTISWKETYKGIVPQSELDELENTEELRIKNSYENFDENDNNQFVLEIDNEIVGFVNIGKTEDKEFENCAEIFALYIIGKFKGQGYGKKLFEKAVLELKKLGFNKMLISCLKGNPTNEFYKHMGGIYIKDGIYKRLNLKENVYYFDI